MSMMRRLEWVAGTTALALVISMAWAARATAQIDSSGCTLRSLRGDYAFTIAGEVGPNRLPMRGVAMTTFDGRGALQQHDFVTIGGQPVTDGWRMATGTYVVGPDCTAGAVITPDDGSPALRLRMVIGANGEQVFNIAEGNAVSATGVRVR